MASLPKAKLLERAEAEGLEVEVRGGGWFVVEGRKIRGLDSLEKAIQKAADRQDVTFCLCGCGGEVTRTFRQGHDARLGGILLRVARGEDPSAIPEEAMPHLEELGSLLRKFDGVEIEDVLAVVREEA